MRNAVLPSLFCAALAMGVAGCTVPDIDRPAFTQFAPKENSFVYIADAGAGFGVDDPEAEKTRIRWLEMYLIENHLCFDGYEVKERKATFIRKGIVGDAYSIYYEGVCIDKPATKSG
jgi:hypothetical protein